MSIDPELLRQRLRYDPLTGKLFWFKRSLDFFTDGVRPAAHYCNRWNSHYGDKEAFTSTNVQGYKQGRIYGQCLKAHRVIWAIVHGVWPTLIDHINGVPTDNRLVNLREVSPSENNKNQRLHKRNRSGVPGVRWSARYRKWQVEIGSGNTRRYLGRFTKIEAAIAARMTAQTKDGYHENHGRAA